MTTRAHQTNGGSKAKQKVRKGTRSCWECRRRKMKCIFGPTTDTSCIRCQRRGSKCVGQEFPEEISASLDRSIQMGDRVVRVEALVEKLLQKDSDRSDAVNECTSWKQNYKPYHNIPTTSSVCLEPLAGKETDGFEILQDASGFGKAKHAQDISAESNRSQRLSWALHQHLPSQNDIGRINKACGSMSTLFYQMMTVPYDVLNRGNPESPEQFFKRPQLDIHPVLIARYMLRIATLLQHIRPGCHQELRDFSEPPQAMMDRLSDTAISLVTTNDDLVGCVEGLECVIMESWYHVNGGNLRKGLVAIRRAMTIAQLMGFHRIGNQTQCKILDPKTESHPHFIWFRVVFLERHLCLMLGLPQGTLDRNMASEMSLERDTPMGRLERRHCVIASRILERNQSDASMQGYPLTQELDRDLQRAAAGLPSKWWLTVNLATVKDQPEALFWDTRRLYHQLFHYNLLNQLHLPYMVRSSSAENSYDYSQVTCVNASREVLSRFITFQSFNRFASSCRTFDFFCLMAAMTLLLAHLDGHRRCADSFDLTRGQQATTKENMLAHQRPGDLALVEQIRENLEEINLSTADALNTQSADLLRRLMALEAEAATENLLRAGDIGAQMPAEVLNKGHSNPVHVHIPYFGTIEITREGVISKLPKTQSGLEGPSQNRAQPAIAPAANNAHIHSQGYPSGFDNLGRTFKTNVSAPTNIRNFFNSEHPEPTYGPREEPLAEASADIDHCTAPQVVLQSPSAIPETLLHECEDPLLTAGIDDWAFQGVDLAFFDNLMRGNGKDGAEWHGYCPS